MHEDLGRQYPSIQAQSGFQKTRCTMDHLVRFDSFVRERLLNREHVVSIFFDLEKAYDANWKYGIMKDLHDMDLRERLPLFNHFFFRSNPMHAIERQLQLHLNRI